MLEEARRREDTLSDSSQQLQVGRGPGPGRAGSLPACTWLTLHPPLPLFLTLPAAFLSDQLFSSKGMALNRKGKFYSTALFGNLSKGEGLSPQGDPASLVSSASVWWAGSVELQVVSVAMGHFPSLKCIAGLGLCLASFLVPSSFPFSPHLSYLFPPSLFLSLLLKSLVQRVYFSHTGCIKTYFFTSLET